MLHKKLFTAVATAAVIALSGAFTSDAQAQDTLQAVQDREALRCGVNVGLAGFSIANEEGRWTGLDVDYCRALAAAVLGDADAVEFVPLSAQARFTALQSRRDRRPVA